MQKKFVGSLALLLFVNLLVKPVWIFGIDLEVQNQVGAEAYGLYAAMLSFVMIFNIVLDLGLAHYSNREIAQDPNTLARHFSELFMLKLSLGLFYFLLALGLGFFMGYWHQASGILIWLSLAQVFSSALFFLRSHLAGLHLFKWDAFFSVLDKSLMILLAGYFLYFYSGGISVEIFAMLQAFSFGFSALLATALILWKVPYFKPHIRLQKFKSRLSSSLPYALLIFLMALYTRVDSVMLQQLVGETETGIYVQAFRLLDALNQPAYLFSVILLPMFSTLFAKKESVSELARLSFVMIYVMSLSVALASFFESDSLMAALYVEHSESSSFLLKLLIFSSLAFGSTYVFGTMLTAKGSLKVLNYIAFSGFVLNIILNALLIPIYGASGAAVATLSTQSLSAGAQAFYSFKLARINWGAAFVWRFLAYTLQALLLAYAIHHFLAWDWWLKLLIIALSSSLSVLFWKVLSWQMGIDLLRRRFYGG